MRLAIFDIDGTLVPDASSEVRFFRYLWQRRALGPRQLSAFACFVPCYLPRFGRHVMQKNKAYLSGQRCDRIDLLAQQFVAEVLNPVLFVPALTRLRMHQQLGDAVALLSGTPQFLADALGAALGVEYCLGAVCQTKKGRFTAAPPYSHPYAWSKVDAARTLSDRVGLPLAEAVAYGDSIHDMPLFHAVGEAVVVAPGRRLLAEAVLTGWEVLDLS